MAKSSGREEDPAASTSWLGALALLTLIQTSAFLAVTLWQFQQITELEAKDDELQYGIHELFHVLSDIRGVETEWGAELPDAETPRDAEQRGHHRVARRQTSFIVDILKAQEAIFERHCHDLNKTCPAGSKGERGLVGEKGATGAIGDPGLVGAVGDPGKQGRRGDKGAHGLPGLKGETGTSGSRGALGTPGKQGDQGATGVTGSQGAKGPQGPKGLTGNGGDRGTQGTRGFQGVSGLKGVKGERGPPGPPGEVGPTGPPGADVKLLPAGCVCLKKPVFVSSDTVVDVNFTGDQKLPCAATGNPIPVITARKDNSVGKRLSIVQLNSLRRRTEWQANSSVELHNVKLQDYGRYTCEARNMFGTASKQVVVRPPSHVGP